MPRKKSKMRPVPKTDKKRRSSGDGRRREARSALLARVEKLEACRETLEETVRSRDLIRAERDILLTEKAESEKKIAELETQLDDLRDKILDRDEDIRERHRACDRAEAALELFIEEHRRIRAFLDRWGKAGGLKEFWEQLHSDPDGLLKAVLDDPSKTPDRDFLEQLKRVAAGYPGLSHFEHLLIARGLEK